MTPSAALPHSPAQLIRSRRSLGSRLSQFADPSIVAPRNGACAGSTDFLSFLIDYRPVKRVDLYAGVLVSNVHGGLANGYQVTQNIAPTAGLRIKF